jgi:type I restriction enzyme S subunit
MSDSLVGRISVLSGWAFPSSGFNLIEGLPLIRIRDLGKRETEIKFQGRYDPAYVVREGDILIGMDGDFSAYKWTGGPALLNQRVCKVESFDEHLDQGFLYWYLMPHVAEIHRRTPQTTVRHLSASSLFNVVAPSFGLDEQQKVAQVLDTLDTTIRQTEAIIAKLKQVKQGLLHDLLTRGIAANGELRPPQSEAPHLYKASPLGWIPAEWHTQRLADFTASDITYGIVQAGPHIEGGIPYIRTGDMSGDFLDRAALQCTSTRISKSYARSEVRTGDIVMAIRATVGKVLPVPVELDGANLTQGTARIAPNADSDPIFLLWALRYQRTQDSILAEIKGTTFAEITLAALREIPVAAPVDLAEQRAIAERMQACECRIDAERQQLQKLKHKKSGLMDELLTGRVRVTPLLQDHGQSHPEGMA